MFSAEYIAKKLQERKEHKEKVVYEYLIALQKRKEIDLKAHYPGIGLSGCSPNLVPNFRPDHRKLIASSRQVFDETVREEEVAREALKTVGCMATDYENPYSGCPVLIPFTYHEDPMVLSLFASLSEKTTQLLSMKTCDKSSPTWQTFQEKVAELERNGTAAGLQPEPLPEQLINILFERITQVQSELQAEREQNRKLIAEIESLKMRYPAPATLPRRLTARTSA